MKKKLLIGVVITSCNIEFQEEILSGIIAQAFKSNCDIAVISTLHNFYIETPHKILEGNIFELIGSDRFDGFLYDRNTFFGDTIKTQLDNILAATKKPVMLLDSEDHKLFESTAIDDSDAFEKITDHLIEVHGCNKIYCLTGPKQLFVSEERLRGFKNSMKKHGLYYDRSCCIYGDFWKDAAKKLAEKIISSSIERPDAVVCGNDVSAMSLISALTAAGIRVPEDIAVTGYDASADCYDFKPPVTTFKRPNYQLGAEAFRRLYRIITGSICTKIPNNKGDFVIGHSCGCAPSNYGKSNDSRRLKINKMFEDDMLHRDMIFDITNVDNINDFVDRLDNYTYYIYKMQQLNICLTRKYLESAEENINNVLTFSRNDEMKMILSKSTIRRIYDKSGYFPASELLPVFSEKRSYPVAYYIVPLHYNNNFFGYASVSFGKRPMSFSEIFIFWINYVNIALEQVRIRSILNHTISGASFAMLHDENTGLPNKSGMEKAFLDFRERCTGTDVTADFIRIQIAGYEKAPYHNNEEKYGKIIAAFAELLGECVETGEIFGLWSPYVFGIVTALPDRSEKIYRSLSEKIKKSRYGENNCNVDFGVYLHSQLVDENADLQTAMHKASINRIYSYTVSEKGKNPQFEKLCLLRGKLIGNPELPWKISRIAEDLFISKSYLQKIYKSYFGKSIIEELIQFRLDKAKELLTGSDLSVTEIASRCGYSSYNYFVRQFKDIEGVSPSEFREKSES